MILQHPRIAIRPDPEGETIILQPAHHTGPPLVAGQPHQFREGQEHHDPSPRRISSIC